MKYQLNLTALSCPIPLLTAKKALANLESNDELVLQLNRQSAVENDVILIAGKGHEDYQIIGKTKHYFSDQEVARHYLSQ